MNKTLNVATWAIALLLQVNVVSAQIIVSGSDTLNIDFAESSMHVFESAHVNLLAGSDISGLQAANNSSVEIGDGAIVSQSNFLGNSSLNVNGGQISFINAMNQSTVNLSGGDIGWLRVFDDATINIYAESFELISTNILSGKWFDGTEFKFWLVGAPESGLSDPALPPSPLPALFLPTPITTSGYFPSGVNLYTVPAPSSFVLLLSGLMLLGFCNRIKKGSGTNPIIRTLS